MTSSDPNDRPNPSENHQAPPPEPGEDTAPDQTAAQQSDAGDDSAGKTSRRRVLIGSQRDPAAYQSKRPRDWIPIGQPQSGREKPSGKERPEEETAESAAGAGADVSAEPPPPGSFPVPNVRDRLPPDLEQELAHTISDASFDQLLSGGDSLIGSSPLEEQSQHTGRVVAVQRDDVFVDLGGHEQGCVSLKLFDQPPEPGTTIEVVVQRFNDEDGLYDLTIPQAVVKVDDWTDLSEGMLVDAVVTGHNSGGLECEVNRARGFIPISQVSLYRVEDMAQFVGEKFTCLVTEANPQRRNLVLSRRAVLEREKEDSRQKLLDSLQPGQVHEGVVRKLVDFGAFVDIGGIDGLLHVSQLAWGRINHPSDVLAEGQKIKVKIEKIDHATGKMSLAYRDMLENPWDKVVAKYPAHSVVKGTVTKLMEFGAFVELEPGVEGLVHISELSHRRVWRASDVVKPGEQIEVLVLSVDPQSQRISLSMKELSQPEPAKRGKDSGAGELPPATAKRKKPGPPLRGGLERSGDGDKFGLKW